jgi:hypothetical protein
MAALYATGFRCESRTQKAVSSNWRSQGRAVKRWCISARAERAKSACAGGGTVQRARTRRTLRRTDASGMATLLNGARGSTLGLANSAGSVATNDTYQPSSATTTGGERQLLRIHRSRERRQPDCTSTAPATTSRRTNASSRKTQSVFGRATPTSTRTLETIRQTLMIHLAYASKMPVLVKLSPLVLPVASVSSVWPCSIMGSRTHSTQTPREIILGIQMRCRHLISAHHYRRLLRLA